MLESKARRDDYGKIALYEVFLSFSIVLGANFKSQLRMLN